MYITFTLSKEWLAFIRKLLIFMRLKRWLAQWRKLESKHWRSRGLVRGRTRYIGMPDFTLNVFQPWQIKRWISMLHSLFHRPISWDDIVEDV